ncbi:MAG: lysophospholipid acyltransferase family protein [Rickettsiales bacterium]|nr:lysophospholipid acyltransferase family protein [Rickettsiales bacterium]
MKLSKRIMSSRLFQSFVVSLLRWYILLAYKTTRWTFKGQEQYHDTIRSAKPAVYCMWHGRLILTPMLWPKWGTTIHSIVSQHKDGELISQLLESFNFKPIRGSSGKKGRLHVVKETLRLLKEGGKVCITPDGPRGPRMRFNSTIVDIAIRNNALIVPVAFSTSNGKFFNSWDKFLLPLPFGKGIVYYGEPVETNSEIDASNVSEIEETLEQALNHITQEADEFVGNEPIVPAELNKE